MPDVSDLIGVWRLVEARATDGNGNAMPPPYGGTGLGVISFHPGGRMVAAICQAEVGADGKREYSSYCGRYSFDGKTLVTHVDATAEPSRMGSDQVREVTMQDGRMVLHPPPRPLNGQMQHRELFWEKVA